MGSTYSAAAWTFVLLVTSSLFLIGCDESGELVGPVSVDPAWIQPISMRAVSRPLRTDASRVYLSTPGGVAALDQRTGETIWHEGSAPGLVGWPYVVAGDVVVVITIDAISGLSATDGHLLWDRTTEGETMRVAVGSPSGLFVSDGVTLESYDPQNGALRWSTPIDSGGNVLLSTAGELVCAERLVHPPDDARLTCFDTSSGSVLWSRFVHSPPWIAVTDRRVLVAGLSAGEGPGWMGLDPETGETIWENSGLSGDGSALSPEAETLYACGTECIAVEVEQGSILWRTTLNEEAGSPIASQDAVFVVQSGGTLLVLDPESGDVREKILPDPSEGSGFCGTPANNGDMVFLFGCRGNLYAYENL